MLFQGFFIVNQEQHCQRFFSLIKKHVSVKLNYSFIIQAGVFFFDCLIFFLNLLLDTN